MDILDSTSPLYWADRNKLMLTDGIYFKLKNLPYLKGLLDRNKKVTNVIKGTQICATTAFFLDSVHACLFRRYDKNIIYMMPTVKQVESLCKISFDPIINFNPVLRKACSVNNSSIKTINGRSIVFVGAQPQKVGGSNVKDSVQARTTPADCIRRDEYDLMDVDIANQMKQRLNASMFRHEDNFGSPTYPGYGIDAKYHDSDQGKWQIKCSHCGKYTCLVESFPDSIIKINGVWIRACVHCHKEIYVVDGDWECDFPDRREAGRWVDGLISPFADLEEYSYRYRHTENNERLEFERSILGRAVADTTSQLTEEDVHRRCSGDGILYTSQNDMVMGVDIGKVIHVVVGFKTGKDTYEIVHMSRHKEIATVHDLAQKMNVRCAVIDSGPHDHGVREFQKQEPYAVYLCQYSEQMPGEPKYDPKTMFIKCNRNEMCGRVHAAISQDKIVIPRRCDEVNRYAYQMTRTAKTMIENPDTGVPKPKWIKLAGGEDHYFHSTLYFLLATKRIAARRKGDGIRVLQTKQVNNYRI